MFVTLPNQRHSIASDYRTAISVTLEPESMPDGVIEALGRTAARTGQGRLCPQDPRRLRAARASAAMATSPPPRFDEMCFGEALPRRVLDPRVMRAVARIERFSGEPVTADTCAAEAGLSASRFLHLFKEETGISFRSFRAWKRARHLLHFANQDPQPRPSRAGHRLSRLHPFQPLDPPLLRIEAARDLRRLARSCDLSQHRDGAKLAEAS